MLKLKWIVKGDHWNVWIRLIDRFDRPLFTFTWIETRGCNCNLLTGNPVHWSSNLNLGGTWQRSLIHQRPGRLPLDTVHLKSTLFDSDALVTEDG